jgi:hypothetical protein
VEIALIRQREIGRLRPSAGDEATLLVNEPESIWFVVGLQILGNAADHGVPRVASKYTVRSVQTRASSFKELQSAHLSDVATHPSCCRRWLPTSR